MFVGKMFFSKIGIKKRPTIYWFGYEHLMSSYGQLRACALLLIAQKLLLTLPSTRCLKKTKSIEITHDNFIVRIGMPKAVRYCVLIYIPDVALLIQ